MITKSKPLGFGRHALAVLGAVMLGSTIFSLIWSAGLAFAIGDRLPGVGWLLAMTIAAWLGVFIIALPTAGILLSLLWPITRSGTIAARGLCVLAGVTAGILASPLASPKFAGATLSQMGIFALTGAVIAAIYLLILQRVR